MTKRNGATSEEISSTISRLVKDALAESSSPQSRKKLEKEVRQAIDELADMLADIDPVARPSSVFDPSNPRVMARFVALALVSQDRCALSDVTKFYGSGVYAIYYRGDFELYAPISGTETPIYVGQAAPKIKGARNPYEQGMSLVSRLNEHKRSILRAKETLSLEDFECRSLVVQSGYEANAEHHLIHMFSPIWNKETKVVYGIGKHGDSAETRGNKRSPWDTLHAGRKWADGTKHDAKSSEQIAVTIEAHFKKHPVFSGLPDVMASFLDELRQV